MRGSGEPVNGARVALPEAGGGDPGRRYPCQICLPQV